MFDLRYSGIFAATAFALSLLIGLVSRSTMPLLIIRPLIFAVIFFALSAFIKILVSWKLPELLEKNNNTDEDTFKPGSKINILEEDGASDSSAVTEGFVAGNMGQVFSGAKPDDSEDDLGDISELSKRINSYTAAGGTTTGVDQNAKEGYTDEGGSSDSIEPDFSKMFGTESSFEASATSQEKAAGTGANAGAKAGARTEGIFNSDDALPDLDSMAGAFTSGSSNEGSEANDYSVSASLKKSSSAKAPEWTEDFNAKEIAMGLRTVLKKDKEG